MSAWSRAGMDPVVKQPHFCALPLLCCVIIQWTPRISIWTVVCHGLSLPPTMSCPTTFDIGLLPRDETEDSPTPHISHRICWCFNAPHTHKKLKDSFRQKKLGEVYKQKFYIRMAIMFGFPLEKISKAMNWWLISESLTLNFETAHNKKKVSRILLQSQLLSFLGFNYALYLLLKIFFSLAMCKERPLRDLSSWKRFLLCIQAVLHANLTTSLTATINYASKRALIISQLKMKSLGDERKIRHTNK